MPKKSNFNTLFIFSILAGMALLFLPAFTAEALPNQSPCTRDDQCDTGFCAPGYDVCANPDIGLDIKKPESELQPLQFKPQVPIPGYTFNPADKSTGNIANLVKALYNYGISIVGIVAAIAMVIGGFVWMTAGGNASKVGEAQAWIGSALTGLVLALSSWFLFNTISPDLVKLKVRSITGINATSNDIFAGKTSCGTGKHLAFSDLRYDFSCGFFSASACQCVSGEGGNTCEVTGQLQNCLKAGDVCAYSGDACSVEKCTTLCCSHSYEFSTTKGTANCK